MRKRLISSILAVCLILAAIPAAVLPAFGAQTWSSTGTDVLIDEAHFPDDAFRGWLLDANHLDGAGADGILTDAELQEIHEINVSDKGIRSLAGISVFYNLKVLNVSDNDLQELDVSANAALERLYCSYNRLTELDLSQNTQLITLICAFNQLTRLDVSNKPRLENLNCENNRLTALNLTGSNALVWLYCRNNLITALELSTNTALRFVSAFDNQLTSIDVRNLTELEVLHVDHNRLTELDLSQNLNLSQIGGGFAAGNNYLEKLILPSQPSLTVLLDAYEEQEPITGYERVRWYLDESYTKPVTGQLTAQGQTLYARRIPNDYVIRFSNSYGSGSMQDVRAVYDQAVKLPKSDFTRSGYIFHSWNTLPNGTGESYTDEQSVVNLAGRWNGDRVTLYAQWEPIAYQVAFDANHTDAVGEMDSIRVSYQQIEQLPVHAFSVSGKVFAGWAAEPDGEVRYADGATIQNLSTISDSIVTLYAVWQTPVAELQQPYLEELEQVFLSYASQDYTMQDWSALSESYAAGVQGIRASDEAEEMEKQLQQATQKMQSVNTKQMRIDEITSGWHRKHQAVIGRLGQKIITQQSSVDDLQQSRDALYALTAEQLKGYSTLSQADELQQVAGMALDTLRPIGNALTAFYNAADWLVNLGDMPERPLAQVGTGDADAYRVSLAAYDAMDFEMQANLHIQIRAQLSERLIIAEEKQSASDVLRLFYHSMDLQQYSEAGQTQLLDTLEAGLQRVEAAASQAQIREEIQLIQNEMTQIPKKDEQQPGGTDDENNGGAGDGSGDSNAGNSGNNGSSGGSSSGSGGVTQRHAIHIAPTEHGSVTADRISAGRGQTVSLSIKVHSGYVLDTLTVTTVDGSQLPITDRSEGTFTFVMPDSAVTVKAVFRQESSDVSWENPFADVHEQAWYFDAVRFVKQSGLFSGMDETTFAPEHAMTRAMLITVLYRAAGSPAVAGSANAIFADVDDTSYYGSAVVWAWQNGITSGVSEERFGPEESITREQLAAMLHRYEKTQLAFLRCSFTDMDQASDYAKGALAWAVENGILNGMGDGRIDPAGTATRAQVSQILMNFMTREKN